MELFPVMKSDNLELAALTPNEEQAQYYLVRALEVFDLNMFGPQEYVATYAKYADLLTSKAEREAESFLAEERSIDEMRAVIYFKYRNISFVSHEWYFMN